MVSEAASFHKARKPQVVPTGARLCRIPDFFAADSIFRSEACLTLPLAWLAFETDLYGAS